MNGEVFFKVFRRGELFSKSNRYKTNIAKHPDLMPHIALLLGNDYFPRLPGNGPTTVFMGSLDKTPGRKKKVPPRCDDSMLHKMGASRSPLKYIKEFGNQGKRPMEEGDFERFEKCLRYMLHVPVLEYDEAKETAKLVPLNSLPHGHKRKWEEYLGIPGVSALSSDASLLLSICRCDVLPLNRQKLTDVPLPTFEGRSMPLFGELDFQSHPLKVQPKLCIVNWLRARGIDARMTDQRMNLEKTVINAQRVKKKISPVALEPVEGEHNRFAGILPRQLGNEYDNWCCSFVAPMKKLWQIDDNVIDRHLAERKGQPSIRGQVQRLISSGNYDVGTIKCRNIAARDDVRNCILFNVDCISSTTRFVHKVYAVFESCDGGEFLRSLSSCSCKKGEHFCSHAVGFLYVVGIVQSWISTEEEFVKNYRINPDYTAAVPMLIENVIAVDSFNQQREQRKRRTRKLESSDDDSN